MNPNIVILLNEVVNESLISEFVNYVISKYGNTDTLTLPCEYNIFIAIDFLKTKNIEISIFINKGCIYSFKNNVCIKIETISNENITTLYLLSIISGFKFLSNPF